MDAYKVKSIVKNGQLIIDLPEEFNEKEVEVTVFQVAQTAYGETSEDLSVAEEVTQSSYLSSKQIEQPEEEVQSKRDESDFIHPHKKIDLRTLRGAIKSDLSINEIDAIARSMRGDSPFVPPRKRIKLSTLMGAYKNKLTNDEIDSLTKGWRNEWNRDIS